MTRSERLYALYNVVKYVIRREIPGDFVECGVWRGGSVMMMALTLQRLGTTRKIHCFDTFDGMPPPGELDVAFTGETAASLLARTAKRESEHMWGIAAVDLVRRNIESTGYPLDLVGFHKGRVEETIPGDAPTQIAILRLDTCWHDSTKHELVHLYPRLSPGGVLFLDDYGFWRGARKATDEYFAETGAKLLLNRIDDAARIAIKPG